MQVFASLFESQKDVLFSQDTIDTIFSRQIDEVIMVAQEFASALEDALSFNKASERNTYTRWKLLEIVLTVCFLGITKQKALLVSSANSRWEAGAAFLSVARRFAPSPFCHLSPLTPPQPGRFQILIFLPPSPFQGDELETFCKFADDVDAARRELSHALSIAEVKSYLHSVNPQCLLAVKYELPNLLLEPLYHLHHYVACVEVGSGSLFCAFLLLAQRAFMLPVLLTVNLLSPKRRRFWRTAAPIPPCKGTVKDFSRWAFAARAEC